LIDIGRELREQPLDNGDSLIPALLVFGRIHGSNVDQAAVFLKKDAEAAKKAALDAGLSSLEVQTDEHRQVAATMMSI
jgi:hypothetical protein